MSAQSKVTAMNDYTKYASVRVTHVADAVDKLGADYGSGGSGLTFYGESRRCAIGRAFTVQQVEISQGEETVEKPRHGEAVTKLSQPGDIVVIDVPVGVDVATWGEAHTLKAIARGLAGVLVNGGARDVATLRTLPFPALIARASPFKSFGRIRTSEIGGAVSIGETRVETGDILVIGDEGFMVLPQSKAVAVLDRALAIAQLEIARDDELFMQLASLPGAARRSRSP